MLGLAGGGVCQADTVADIAVRSYRTISPLPVNLLEPSAVYFLLHFPWNRSRWPLATAVPCPARTFLRFFQTGGRPTHSILIIAESG